MKQTPLVSVLMPAYNQAEYISEAIDSLQRQTYKNWEVAIVDDGSPDNVAEIVAEYVASDPRIKFYHTDNQGVSAARNFAASKTSGELIIPLDADDTFHPEYIARCVEAFQNTSDLKVVYCRWKMFGVTKKTPSVAYANYENLLINNSIFCSAMYRREDFERIGGYDIQIPFGFEDWEFWISLLDKDSKVLQIDQPLFNYRIKKKSRSSDVNAENNRLETLEYIYRKHQDKYCDAFPDILHRLQRLKYYEYRDNKWKKRSLLSRLWHAFKGTI